METSIPCVEQGTTNTRHKAIHLIKVRNMLQCNRWFSHEVINIVHLPMHYYPNQFSSMRGRYAPAWHLMRKSQVERITSIIHLCIQQSHRSQHPKGKVTCSYNDTQSNRPRCNKYDAQCMTKVYHYQSSISTNHGCGSCTN